MNVDRLGVCATINVIEFQFTPPPKLKQLSAAEFAPVDDGLIESAVVGYVVDHLLGPGDELHERHGRLEERLRDARIRFLRNNAPAMAQASRKA